jgi:hypothetical protein
VITYSGHGGQLPDMNNDEEDGLDETWCLFDGELLDDELGNLWTLFPEGIRILVISDSCHSGTVTKAMLYAPILRSGLIIKAMPDEIKYSTYFQNKEFYDNIFENLKTPNVQDIKASVKLISGCQDNQSSYDGPFNGQFTGYLKQTWNGGKFSGNYDAFHKKIMKFLPDYQTPNHQNIGTSNPVFDNQKPFSI